MATLYILDMFKWFDPIPINDPALRCALVPVEILRLLFIPLSRLPSFLLDPALPRKPLKKDFINIYYIYEKNCKIYFIHSFRLEI